MTQILKPARLPVPLLAPPRPRYQPGPPRSSEPLSRGPDDLVRYARMADDAGFRSAADRGSLPALRVERAAEALHEVQRRQRDRAPAGEDGDDPGLGARGVGEGQRGHPGEGGV